MPELDPAPARLFIRQLGLSQFRNYATLTLKMPAKHLVFVGPNGAGKTNLLEAVSLLSPGRGLRRSPAQDLASRSQETGGFALNILLEKHENDYVDETSIGIGMGSIVGENEGSRKLRINGANAQKQDQLLDYCRVTWLTPAMDGLFTGPAADRRRFLDRLVLAIEPNHARQSLNFEKAMRQRNRLLTDQHQDPRYFEAIEIQMAEAATAIAAARAETVALLTHASQALGDKDGFPVADLALEGHLENQITGTSASDVEEDYIRLLADERRIDQAAGRTRFGPHRSDLHVYFSTKNMPAALSSTGEQKALLSGLVLAHAQMVAQISGMAPILLLDEVGAHFDMARRIGLFAILDRLKGQALMTGTERQLFEGLDDRAAYFRVDDGGVHGEEMGS